MYNKLKDNIVQGNRDNRDEIDEKISKEMRLNGVVILDTTVDDKENEHFDISDAVLMDKDIEFEGKSSYLKVELKKDGEPKKNQDIISRTDFSKMTEYVKKKIISTDTEILKGNIEILPCGDGKLSACDYCEMSEVCLFDKNKDSIRSLCKNEEEAWEIIDNEIKK